MVFYLATAVVSLYLLGAGMAGVISYFQQLSHLITAEQWPWWFWPLLLTKVILWPLVAIIFIFYFGYWYTIKRRK